MSKVTMSVHRALAEKKTYDDRIRNAMSATFVAANKKSNDKIGGKTIPEIITAIEANYASVTSLIENKKRIAAAIVASNAVTEVDIAGKKYTVANAVERKKLIELEERFLATLKNQYTREKTRVENENAMLPSKLESYLASALGGEKAARKPEDVEKYTKDFEDRNKFELIDPAKIEDKIKALEKDIIDFKTNVDYVLSESNATTMVDVEFID